MKNWKTTLIGFGGAVAMGGGQLLSSGSLDWKAYIQMAFMALIGTFAKDLNVSGGSVQQ
jgi:hypothetical protein